METSHKHGLEKRSVKKVFKKILGGVIKGLFFRFLWGEERALDWEQSPLANDSIKIFKTDSVNQLYVMKLQ